MSRGGVVDRANAGFEEEGSDEFEPAPRAEIWVVQTRSLWGWENSWIVNDAPHTFSSEAEAQAELRDHMADRQWLCDRGEIDEPDSWDDYRIVRIE